MKYVVVMEKIKDLNEPEVFNHEGQEDGIQAIGQLKFLSETFAKEIKEKVMKVYLIIE